MLIAIKGDSNTITVKDFNIPLTPMDRSSRQKINKETQGLNDTSDQIDLIDIYRIFYLKAAEYTFFSSAHGTFSKIDHILGHKSSLSKFKKIEIVSSIFSDYNTMRLDIITGRKLKRTNTWRLNNTSKYPRGHWRNQRGKKENNPRNKWQWKHDDSKRMGCNKSSSKREVYRNTILPQQTR